MKDAAYEKLPKQMRTLFVMLVSEVGLIDVKRLFEKYKDALSEDFQHQLLPPNNVNHDLIQWMLLIDIQD